MIVQDSKRAREQEPRVLLLSLFNCRSVCATNLHTYLHLCQRLKRQQSTCSWQPIRCGCRMMLGCSLRRCYGAIKKVTCHKDGVDRLICYGQRGNDAVPKSKDWCSMLSQLCLNGARHPKDGSTEQMAKAKAIVSCICFY